MNKELIGQILNDLYWYGSCKVCKHYNTHMYTNGNCCDLNGCNGGGSGKIKEDRWEYRGIDYKDADIKEVESILKDYNEQHSNLMKELATE